MLYKTIPGTSRPFSSLVLGTDHFGTAIPQEEAFALMDRYTEQGGNVLDTARMYGCWVEGGDGASEKTIGAWLKSRNCREDIILVTKCAHHELNDRSHRRLSREDIRNDVEESLKALDTDWIDLLFLHRDDANRSVEEIIDSLDELVCEGKVRAIGASNWHASRIKAANNYAQKTGKTPFCASQIQWSLAKENDEALQEDPTLVRMDDTEYSFYQEQKFPVFAFSSQAKGFFKKLEGGKACLSEKAKIRYYNKTNLEYYNRAEFLAKEKGVSVTAVIVSYITSQAFPAFALLGCKNQLQLQDSLASSELTLTDEELRFLLGI